MADRYSSDDARRRITRTRENNDIGREIYGD